MSLSGCSPLAERYAAAKHHYLLLKHSMMQSTTCQAAARVAHYAQRLAVVSVQERQALREEVVKLELLLQAQNDKIVRAQPHKQWYKTSA
jgi:hypothetical protein